MSHDARSRPLGKETASEIELLAGNHQQCIDSKLIEAEVERAAIAAVFAIDTVDVGRRTTAAVLPSAFTIPDHRTAWQGILTAVQDGQLPHPVAVGLAIHRAGIQVPPTWNGCLQSRLWELAADPPPPAMAEWLLAQVQDQAVRRRVESMLTLVGAAVHRGDLRDLAAVVQQQASDVLARLYEVTG